MARLLLLLSLAGCLSPLDRSPATDTARGILVDSGFATPDDFAALGLVAIHVLPTELGRTWGSVIEVGPDYWSLAHEEIHQLRYRRDVNRDAENQHEEWERLHLFVLSDFFVWSHVGVKSCDANDEILGAWGDGLQARGWNVLAWATADCGDANPTVTQRPTE